ncbi:carbon-phosphorus lyase complex subunit PhnI [Teichococcus cervicalis]
MAYVAVKGGEAAIANAHAWLAEARRGDAALAELEVEQIEQQLGLAVDRVMAEGACHDRGLAALAIKQAQGDLIEAAFLLRAYRTTLPRFGHAAPLDTGAMRIRRRVSATYKDLPGGQVLGPTYDYTHRLLDFALAAEGGAVPPPAGGRAAGARPARDRAAGPRRADGARRRCGRGARRPDAPAADLPRRPPGAAAESGARR